MPSTGRICTGSRCCSRLEACRWTRAPRTETFSWRLCTLLPDALPFLRSLNAHDAALLHLLTYPSLYLSPPSPLTSPGPPREDQARDIIRRGPCAVDHQMVVGDGTVAAPRPAPHRYRGLHDRDDAARVAKGRGARAARGEGEARWGEEEEGQVRVCAARPCFVPVCKTCRAAISHIASPFPSLPFPASATA